MEGLHTSTPSYDSHIASFVRMDLVDSVETQRTAVALAVFPVTSSSESGVVLTGGPWYLHLDHCAVGYIKEDWHVYGLPSDSQHPWSHQWLD